MSSFISG